MTGFRLLFALPFALLSLPAHATTTGVEPGDVEIHIVSPADGAEVSSPVDVVVVEWTGQIWDAEVLVDGVPAAECDLWDLGGDECTMSIPMLLGEHTITVRGDIEGTLIDDDSITVTVVAVSDTEGTGGTDSGSGESHGEASDDAGTAEGGSEATESADDGMTSGESDDGATSGAADDGATTAAGDDGSTTGGGGGGGDGGDEGGASRGCSIGDAGRPLPLLALLVLGLARRRRIGARRRR